MFTLQEQVNDFYKFIGDIIKIHHSNPDISDSEIESIKVLERQLYSKNDENNIKIKEMTPILNKILYRLYIEKGIKRKLIGSLIQLFYDKSNKNYDKNDSITQLCRHLVIDPKNLRIVSLGVTKSVDYDEFKETFEFPTISIEEFPDGTMCVYTPDLMTYQSEIQFEKMHDDDNSENVVDSDTETKPKRVKDFRYSTRKVLGTGYFNSPTKSFSDMFKENNDRMGIDMSKLPDEYVSNHSFVFNVQHPENRIISPIKNNGTNTLVGVYKYKDEKLVNEQWETIVSSIESETFNTNIKAFANDMVVSLNLTEFTTEMASKGFNFTTVKDITEDISKLVRNYHDLETYVNCQPYEFQGLVLKNSDGIRTKIRNSNYESIRELKGSLPVMIEERNTSNLFKTFWRLRQKHDGSLTKFCQYFGKFEYNSLFNCFNLYVHGLTNTLHQTYLNAFVYKNINKVDIPFHLKPLCGELHKIYMQNKQPITFNIVANFINNLPFSMIYWRIFKLEDVYTDTSTTANVIESASESTSASASASASESASASTN